jgi:hypothetical protein
MAPHQERVVQERKELNEKIEKLCKFIQSETFAALDAAEKNRMGRQLKAMISYENALGERIDAFHFIH